MLTALLRLTRASKFATLNDLSTASGLPGSVIEAIVSNPNHQGQFSIIEDAVTVSTSQRIRIALDVMRDGGYASTCREMRWQEFEELAEEVLRFNAYRAYRHVVFESSLGRREIDLVAVKADTMLCIDCKHRRRMPSSGDMNKMAAAQQLRTVEFSKQLTDFTGELGLDGRGPFHLIPVILTLHEPSLKLANGVPIVPISALPSFLAELSPFIQGIHFIRAAVGRPSTVRHQGFANGLETGASKQWRTL